MQQIILFTAIAVLGSSCASIYAPPAPPTPFLEKSEGAALQISAGTNLATNFLAASVTKATSTNVCINISGELGVMGNYVAKGNSFSNSKKMNQLAVNFGYNTRKLTVYPIQLWAGIHAGKSGDSYFILPLEDATTKDVNNSTIDTLGRFEYAKGNYIGTRFGLSHMINSNYNNDPEIKARKKIKLDLIGTLSLTSIGYHYKNGINPTGNNHLLGYNTNFRVYTNKWILGINLDNNVSVKQLVDDVAGNKNPTAAMFQYPNCVPSIYYTIYLNRKK
jgi:hypothetical protein